MLKDFFFFNNGVKIGVADDSVFKI
jgi:hypothetical protein